MVSQPVAGFQRPVQITELLSPDYIPSASRVQRSRPFQAVDRRFSKGRCFPSWRFSGGPSSWDIVSWQRKKRKIRN